MTTALIIFGISLLAAALMLWSKQRELSTGRSLIRIGTASSDMRVASLWGSIAHTLTHVTVLETRAFVRKAVLLIENLFIDLFHYVARRFVSAGNVITGHNIPKNRGSVSFFLKNIEEHKRTVSER